MKTDEVLRQHLVSLLSTSGAHATFDAAVKGMPVYLRGKKPKGAEHTPWQLLEHIRIAQWDFLEFIKNPAHVSPDFPDGYWPESPEPPSSAAWTKSVKAVRDDLAAMIKIVEDPSTDLFAKIQHGDGQTVLREALVLADHNAYHVGQFILLRRLLGAWK